MTIEQLVGKSAAELKAMSDEDVLKYFEPYLKFTRPDLAEKPQPNNKRSIEKPTRELKNRDILAGLLGSMGVSLDELRRK